MSKTIKRVLSMVFALVLIFSMVPTGAFHHHAHAERLELVYNMGYKTGNTSAPTPWNAFTGKDGSARTLPYADGFDGFISKEGNASIFAYYSDNAGNCSIASSLIQIRGKFRSRIAMRLEGFPVKDAEYNMTATIASGNNVTDVRLFYFPGATTAAAAVNRNSSSTDYVLQAVNDDGSIVKGPKTATINVKADDVYDPDGDGIGSIIITMTGGGNNNWNVQLSQLAFTEIVAGCDHDWSEPTCTTLATCSKCGLTQGELAAHDYQKANEYAIDTCSVCGALKTTAVCRIGNVYYAGLQAAINAVKDGEEIAMVDRHTINTPADVEGFDNTAGYGLVILGNKSFTIRVAGKALILNTERGIYVGNPNAEEGAEKPTVNFHYGSPVFGENCDTAIYAENVNIVFTTFDVELNGENGKGVWLKDSKISFTGSNSGESGIVNTAGGYNIWAEGASRVQNEAKTEFIVNGEGTNIHLEEGATAYISYGKFSHEVPAEQMAKGRICTYNEETGLYEVSACTEHKYDNACDNTCNLCGATREVGDHVAGEPVEEGRVESTCTQAGGYYSVVYCSECGHEISRNWVDLELADHTPGETVIENNVDPTCTAKGSYDEVVYCSVCGTHEISRNTVSVAALGHKWNAPSTTAPATCDRCGITACGHDDCILPTVAWKGCKFTYKTSYTDKNYSVSNNYVSSTGHTMGSFVHYAQSNTYLLQGANLDHIYIAGNNFSDGKWAAFLFNVSVGGDYNVNLRLSNQAALNVYIVKADTLAFGKGVAENDAKVAALQNPVAVGAATGGQTVNVGTMTFDEGNYLIIFQAVDKGLVRFNEMTLSQDHAPATREENRVEATCGVDGSYDLVTYCSACNEELNREAKVIPATGAHVWGDWVVDKDATCTEAGSKHRDCEGCDAVDTAVIPATGVHTPATREENRVEATCGVDGSYDLVTYCSVCNGELNREAKVIPATGAHVWGDWVVDKDATCTEAGSKHRDCNNCDAVDTAVIPATGAHTEDEGTVTTEPTLNTTGVKTYKCTVCGEVLRTEVIDKLTGAEAEVNGVKYGTLAEAMAIGGTVTLLKDVTVETAIVVDKAVVLNLGNWNVSISKNDTVGDGVFHVVAGGDLTINGTGTIDAVGGSEYCMAIWADGGKVTINGGTYTNVGAGDDDQYDLIYVKNGGEVIINGGTFISETPAWTLNCHDNSYKAGNATIVVNNGEFYQFNPFNNNAEGANTNFVADGLHYADVDGDGIFTKHAEAAGEAVEENRVEATYNADGSYESVVYCSVCGVELSRETVVIPMLTGAEAEVNGVKYGTLAEAMAQGGTVTLLKDVAIDGAIVVDKAVVLELAGYSVSTTENDTNGDGVFHVVAGGDLTINGEGTINGVGGNNYNIAIWADGGKVTINGGYYTNVGATDSTGDTHFDLIYVKNGGEVVINGGKFEAENSKWVLNSHDTAKGTITVYGGEFVGFNPMKNAAEGANTNFMADGLHAADVDGDGIYTVHAEVAGEIVVENNVDPDCENAGSYDNVVYCTVCGEELSRETITVDALGHTEGETVVENVVDATCSATGSYDNVVYCSVCGEELSRETVITDKIAHTEGEIVVENNVAPDCENAGSYDNVIYCTVCGEELSRETITVDALGHKYEAVVTPPQVNVQGYTTYTCSVCGHSYVSDYVDALKGVAYIGDKYYESVQDAIDDAKDGDTVYLNENATETRLNVYENITLDLNGYTLTVAKQVTAYGEIKGEGLLVAPQNKVVLKGQISALPVWNGSGYYFAAAPNMSRAMMSSGQFVFQPQFSDDVKALFANGTADEAGLKIVVTLTYELSGNTFTMEYEVPADKAQDIISKNQTFGLIIEEDFQNLTYTAKVVSDTGAVFAAATKS